MFALRRDGILTITTSSFRLAIETVIRLYLAIILREGTF